MGIAPDLHEEAGCLATCPKSQSEENRGLNPATRPFSQRDGLGRPLPLTRVGSEDKMPKVKPASQPDVEGRSRRESVREETTEPSERQVATGELAGIPDGTPDGASPDAQSRLLGDDRFQVAQRRAQAAKIGRQHGNQHLTKVLSRVRGDHWVEGDTEASGLEYEALETEPPREVTVQRQPKGTQATPPKVVGIIDGTSIATYRDLHRVYQRLLKNLVKEEIKLRQEGGSVPPMVRQVLKKGIQNRDMLANISEGEAIDDVTYDEGVGWYDQYRDALDEIEDARIRKSAANIQKAMEGLEKAHEALSGSMDRIRDAQRQAYLAEESDLAAKILDFAFKANDLATKLVTAKQETHRITSELSNLVGQGAKCPLPVKYLSVFRAIDEVKNALALFSAASDLLSEGKTGMSKSIKAVKAMATIAEVSSSLIKATGGLSLALSPLQSEILDQTLKALGHLIDVAKRINRDLIEQGLFDSVNWDLEPGNRPLFDFMMQVMAAGSPGDIPTPVPGAVSDYMVDNKSDIEKAATGGEEMPTSGWWFWEKVDQGAIAEWVFKHRENLWAIFYGSTRPNSKA